MRSDPAEYDLVAPARSAERAFADGEREPTRWLPIAGGTDVMVQYAAGALRARKLVSISRICRSCGGSKCSRTRFRSARAAPIRICASTMSIAREFPMLAQAASWTGGIANQNRGTIGGNIVNASPAADSLPALLAYDAELILVSVRGERRVPYATFHTGYKKMELAADELIRAVCLPRRFAAYVSHARKVGTRNAQAVSKVCMAALARDGRWDRSAMCGLRSAASRRCRCVWRETERLLDGKSLDAIAGGSWRGRRRRPKCSRSTIFGPRRDIARRWSANLVAEFLEQACARAGSD